LKENPFSASPDLRFLFSTPAHEAAVAELLFAIQARQGLMVLTGESGTGKTTLLQRLLDTLQRLRISSSYIFHSRLDVDDFFQFILDDFGMPGVSLRKAEALQVFHDWLIRRHKIGDTPVVIVDEAQVLPEATLDELRLLLNLEFSGGKLMGIVLAGQPELEEKLRLPELHQLRQRVMFRRRLPQFTLEQTSDYIQSRIGIAGLIANELFPQETLGAIYKHSRGIPRTINLLAEHAIINAHDERKRVISPEDILQIAIDFDLVEPLLGRDKGEGSTEDSRLLQFPVPSPEQRLISALHEAFLSKQRAASNASTAVHVPAEAHPILSTGETPGFPPPESSHSEIATPPAVLEESAASTLLMNPACTTQEESINGNDGSSVQQVVSSAGNALGVETTRPRTRSISEYWKEVASSFCRDAQFFYSDCASFLRGTWGTKNGHTPKRSSFPN
jgi:general secretion pathway protein A